MSEPSPRARVELRAKKILSKIWADRNGPCVVGRSKNRALIEAMAKRGAGSPTIGLALSTILREQIGKTSVERHIRKKCRCFRVIGGRGSKR